MGILRKIRSKICDSELIGTVQGVGYVQSEISIKFVKNRLFSDQKLVRVEAVNGKYVETSWLSVDLTKSETEKLIGLLQESITELEKD